MANSTRTVNEKVKATMLANITHFFTEQGEEVLTVGSNELAMPFVNENGDDIFVTIKVSVPTGSRDGDAYDGYALAEEYKEKVQAKLEKAKAQAEAKAKKIAKDKANREKLAQSKAKAKGE